MPAAASQALWRDCTVADPLLQIRNLTKRFGGVLASDGISLDVPTGELHAVIGPNGAGKSTLIGQLAGEISPDGGRIFFNGRDITRLPTHRRSALGLARSFQITSLFLDFTVLDNVALAVQAHAGHSFRFWRPARSEAKLRHPALAALARVGLERRADVVCANLSHGEHRQLEIAMALATAPRMFLRELKREQTILLIEHDMDAVFRLADRITVLVDGRVIASGVPDDIRSDAAVRQAYLGSQKARHHG